MTALDRPFLRASRLLAVACTGVLAACATGGAPQGGSAPGPGGTGTATAPVVQSWPVVTREHVDLWLHGFAMVMDDTARVPYFRRGYRDQIAALKNGGRVSTLLDANRAQLRTRFVANPGLALNAQFLALSFASDADMRRAIDLFLEAAGDPQRAGDQQAQAVIAFLAQAFPLAADREWLRLFSASLRDEYDKFYRGYWAQTQRDRAPVLAAVDAAWQGTYRPKLQRFLNNTQQQGGELILSIPIGGEGRTSNAGDRSNQVTVTFPERSTDALEAIYVFAHEVVGGIAGTAVNDNTTPAQQREGLASTYVSAAQVRGGALLLQRVAPELVAGYTRFYLRTANVAASSSLATAFPLPANLVEAIDRQLGVVLGGI
jgi:hypothetical protein